MIPIILIHLLDKITNLILILSRYYKKKKYKSIYCVMDNFNKFSDLKYRFSNKHIYNKAIILDFESNCEVLIYYDKTTIHNCIRKTVLRKVG